MGKVVKAITKPISKVLDKIVPNEIKPILPYAAALFPFLAPGAFGAMAGGLGSFGISNPLIQRGLLSGGLNLVSQASQEGAAQRGINPLSLALAAGTGALSGAGSTEALQGAQTVGTSAAGNISAADLASKYAGIDSAAQLGYSTDLSFLDQAKNLGLEGLSNISPSLEQGAKADLFSLDKLKAVAAPVGFTATEQAYNAALDAQSKYDKELAAYNAMTGQLSADSAARRIRAITDSMTSAGFGTSDIEAALRQIGLLAVGGRVGAMNGGIMSTRRGLVDAPGGYSGNRYVQLLQLLEEAKASGDLDKIKEVESDLYREYNKKEIGGSIDGIKALKQKIKDYSNFKKEKRTYEQEDEKMYKNREKEIEKKQFNDYLENLYGVEAKNGGLMGLKMGGTPIEMDYRMGGFIPVGSKERADDVPARLSKNEFVMTADAVRAAGGGSVNKGAQRMYQLMNQLEGKLV
jgi:hypothetical protein